MSDTDSDRRATRATADTTRADNRHATEGYDCVVIGAGLAGLTAAATLAREGRSVVVLERATRLGGRAGTVEQGRYRWNWGPHALYRRHVGARVLDTLGVRYTGRMPDASGGYAVYDGSKETLPGGFVSLLTTGLLDVGAKLETARLLSSLPKRDPRPWIGRPLAEFLESQIVAPRVQQLISALIRLTSYTNAPDLMCAGSALAQLQLALTKNVEYIDGGWQVLVDALSQIARDAGGVIRTGVKVERVEAHAADDCAVRGVRLSDGSFIETAAVVIATSPDVASRLVSAAAHERLATIAGESTAVRAACLDLALSSLPKPRALFGLGIDRALYFSVHSAYADLAPGNGAVVHALKYLAPGESGEDVQKELEALADLLQPGWRDRCVAQRYLPSMLVTPAVVTADGGGLDGRPGPAIEEMDGLFVAGDWVGSRGMLADASLASGEEAGRLVAARHGALQRRAA